MLLRRQGILERCLKRLEWDKVQSREAKAAADAKEAERLAMQSIDWCAWLCRSRCAMTPLISSGSRASIWRVYRGTNGLVRSLSSCLAAVSPVPTCCAGAGQARLRGGGDHRLL